MPLLQHPTFAHVTRDVSADQVDAWLEAGWLKAESDAPAHSAGKAEWVAYAESKGATDADELTKPQLVAKFGS